MPIVNSRETRFHPSRAGGTFSEQPPNDLYFPLRGVMALTVRALRRSSFSPFSQAVTR